MNCVQEQTDRKTKDPSVKKGLFLLGDHNRNRIISPIRMQRAIVLIAFKNHKVDHDIVVVGITGNIMHRDGKRSVGNRIYLYPVTPC